MSYITFDFKCINCEHVEERMVRRDKVAAQKCSQCYCPMQQLMAAPITTFKFGDRSAIKSKKAVSLRDKGSSP